MNSGCQITGGRGVTLHMTHKTQSNSDSGGCLQRLERIKTVVNQKANACLSHLPPQVRKHVRVEPTNGRFLVSHTLLVRAVKAAAAQSDAVVINELRPVPGAYRCVATIRDRKVSADFTVHSVTWDGDQVTVCLLTPRGVDLDGPVLNFIASAICAVFGGTAIGEAILSGPLPAGVRYDGRKLRWSAAISLDHALPSWVRACTPIVLNATHDSRGLWFSLKVTWRVFVWLFCFVVLNLWRLGKDGMMEP